jgi:hypothetical protein
MWLFSPGAVVRDSSYRASKKGLNASSQPRSQTSKACFAPATAGMKSDGRGRRGNGSVARAQEKRAPQMWGLRLAKISRPKGTEAGDHACLFSTQSPPVTHAGAFRHDAEISKVLVIYEPVETAFPPHTERVRAFFGDG